MNRNLYACIMAGGTGTRFWPVSTIAMPKQLLGIVTDKPLLCETIERITPLVAPENQIIITGDPIVDKVKQTATQVPARNIISEPMRRNTAPCILLAALTIAKRDPDAIMFVLPSDHVITKEARFLNILQAAAQLAAECDALITLGIFPHYAETGYGYIEFGEKNGEESGRDYFKVIDFHEKPSAQIAEKYIRSGNYFWNSGMFIWSVNSILTAIKKYQPTLYSAFENIDHAIDTPEIHEALTGLYPDIQGVSIDYGVMERVDNIFGFVADIGWNDVGSWTSLETLLEPDENGNVPKGPFVSLDSSGCIVSANEGLVVCMGVTDLIVVHTPKVTLVCEKERAQEIKDIFDHLEKKKLTEYM